MPPKSNGLVAHVDAAFVQQIFHIAQRQRETNIQHNRQADYLMARFKITKWIRFGHPARLRNCPARLKLICSDSAVRRASLITYPVMPCLSLRICTIRLAAGDRFLPVGVMTA